MGAKFIKETVVAEHVIDGWNKIYLPHYRGLSGDSRLPVHDGTFGMCDFFGVRLELPGRATGTNVAKANAFVQEQSAKCEKYKAYAVDCGVAEYVVTTVKATRAKGSPEIKYLVVEPHMPADDEYFFDSFAEAKKYAKQLASENKAGMATIQKRFIWPDSGLAMATFRQESKTYRTRPKRIPDGAKLSENHLFLFYGLSAI